MGVSVSFPESSYDFGVGAYTKCTVGVSGYPSDIATVSVFVFIGDGTWPSPSPQKWIVNGGDGKRTTTYSNLTCYPGEQVVYNALGYTADDPNHYSWGGEEGGVRGWTTVPAAPKPPRPDKFYWSSSIASGQPISNMTASEWSRFCTNIDKMLTYKGQSLSTYSPARPSSGSLKVVSTPQAGTYTIGYYCRQAARAIRQMGGSVSDPNSTGMLTAAYLTSLQNALNSIK